MGKDTKQQNSGNRGSERRRHSSPSSRAEFELHPEHCEKIANLKPHLLRAIHTVLESHGVDAVVHNISFRPRTAALAGGCPNGQPCCYINGVYTC
jgi:hypothetical protein